MAKRRSKKQSQPGLFPWIAGGVVLVGIVALAPVFFPKQAPTAVLSPEPTIAPKATLSDEQALTEFIADAELVAHHDLPAVAEAGTNFAKLAKGEEIALPTCPGVRIIGRTGHTKEPNTVLIVEPDFGRDGAGNLVLQENIGIETTIWHNIPSASKWSYLWHEHEHIEQDCSLLLQLSKSSKSDNELWDNFGRERTARTAEDEGFPLAVQAYWQRHGKIAVLPVVDTLIAAMPHAWGKELTIGDDGIPLGIREQPEWTEWVALVQKLYVVNN